MNNITNILLTSPDTAELFLAQTGQTGVELKKNIINKLLIEDIRIVCADYLANTVADNVFFINNKDLIIHSLLKYATLIGKGEKSTEPLKDRYSQHSTSIAIQLHANNLEAIVTFYLKNNYINYSFYELLKSLSKWNRKENKYETLYETKKNNIKMNNSTDSTMMDIYKNDPKMM